MEKSKPCFIYKEELMPAFEDEIRTCSIINMLREREQIAEMIEKWPETVVPFSSQLTPTRIVALVCRQLALKIRQRPTPGIGITLKTGIIDVKPE
jgi:hypothetical protein